MRAVLHDSFEAFWEQAGILYEADPGRHSVPLTIMEARASYENGSKPVLVTVHDMTGAVGAYLRTPPFLAHVSALSAECAAAVVDVLREADPHVETVFGPEPEANAFADAWLPGCAENARVAMRQRRYDLGDLRHPSGVAGRPRPFRDADVSVLARWRSEYARDAGDAGVGQNPSEEQMRAFIAGGRVPVLWEVGREPVAMAFVSRPLFGMSRIGHVYTPGRHRGNGYGSAVTAAASDVAREMGATLVMLYTDLANPVSNSIYQRIGFRPVSDLVQLDLRGDGGVAG